MYYKREINTMVYFYQVPAIPSRPEDCFFSLEEKLQILKIIFFLKKNWCYHLCENCALIFMV